MSPLPSLASAPRLPSRTKRASNSHTIRSTRSARTSHTDGARNSDLVNGEGEDDELDDADSGVSAVIQHARRVSAADELDLSRRVHVPHGQTYGPSDPRAGSLSPAPVTNTVNVAVAQIGRGTKAEAEAEKGRESDSIDLDEMGVLQMQWAMPPDRSGIFASSSPPSSPSRAPLRAVSSSNATSDQHVSGSPIKNTARNTFGFTAHPPPSFPDGPIPSSPPIPPISAQPKVRRSRTDTLSSARTKSSAIAPDVPRDVDEDGRSIAHQQYGHGNKGRGSASIHRSMHRTRIHLPGYGEGYARDAADDAGNEVPSTGTASDFSAALTRSSGSGEGEHQEQRDDTFGPGHSNKAASKQEHEWVSRMDRMKRTKSAKSAKSTRSDRSGTSTRALFDGTSGFLSFRQLQRGERAGEDLPASFSDALPTSTSGATFGSKVTGRTGTTGRSGKTADARWTSRSFKISAKRARDSRWTVLPQLSSAAGLAGQTGEWQEEAEEEGEWEYADQADAGTVGGMSFRASATVNDTEQVSLLMYDGSTSDTHSRLGTANGEGKGKGREDRRSKLGVSPAPADLHSSSVARKGKGAGAEKETRGGEEVMDLGLLVGRAAVLERILNAGKRISNTSLHHTVHRPYTPSRLSRSSLSQSFNSALGSAFGRGNPYAYAGQPSSSASNSNPQTPFDDLPPTPRVPEHLLHHLRKKSRISAYSGVLTLGTGHLVRSLSARSDYTTRTGRTGRTWKSATTARTGASGQSGHTARARRHVGRAMMRLTGANGYARHGDMVDEEEYEDDEAYNAPPLPSSALEGIAGPCGAADKVFDVEEERRRLAKRVKGDKDGWGSFADVNEEGKNSISERRPSGVHIGVTPFPADEAEAPVAKREKAGRRPQTTFDIPTRVSQNDTQDVRRARLLDRGDAHRSAGLARPHTALIPSCTASNPSDMDIAALAHTVGGRGIMAPPQCVDDYAIVSASRRVGSNTHKPAGRDGRATARTASPSCYSAAEYGGEKGYSSLKAVQEGHGEHAEYRDTDSDQAQLGWRSWVRKRRMWFLIGAGVVAAGLLMLVGILVGVLASP